MTTLQEHLKAKYSNKEKVEWIEVNYYNYHHCKEIDGGELDLSEYPNLERVAIVGNYLKSPLTKLKVAGCPNLKELWCHNNLLVELDLSKNEKLEELGIGNNNFSEQDLSFLSHLRNLKELRLGNNLKKYRSRYLQSFLWQFRAFKKLNQIGKVKYL